MSTNGILDFQNTNKIIFGGSDSNVVIDTSNVSLGIGIQGTETPGSNLHVVGNAFISSDLTVSGTGALTVPAGTTDDRPATAANGMIRYNSTTGFMEAYSAVGWAPIAQPPTVTGISPLTTLASGGQVAGYGNGVTEMPQPPNAADGDKLGYSVSVSGNGMYALGGAAYDATPNKGALHIYVRNASTNAWTHQQELTIPNITSNDYWGYTQHGVSLSNDGTYAVAGAQYYNSSAGRARVWVRNGTSWSHQQELTISSMPTGAYFGSAVDISSDGNYIIIGAYSDDVLRSGGGAAHIFIRSGTTWSHQATLPRTGDGNSGNEFGVTVGISSDGTYAIVGSPSGTPNTGSAHIYIRSGTTWTHQKLMVDPNGQASDQFGFGVHISGDGNYAAIGSPYDASNTGAGHIFVRSGTSWTHQQQITITSAATGDYAFEQLKLTDDGTVLVASVRGRRDGSATLYGSLVIFTRSGTNWTQTDEIRGETLPNAVSYDLIGHCSDISSDGTMIVSGAYNRDTGGTDRGALFSIPFSEEIVDASTQVFTATGTGIVSGSTVQLEGADGTLYSVSNVTPNADGTQVTFKMGSIAGLSPEFPPSAMTSDTSITGYTVSASYNNYPWKAFDDSTSTIWDVNTSVYDTNTPFLAISSVGETQDISGTSHRGHWIQLQIPSSVILTRTILGTSHDDHGYGQFVILGSNDAAAAQLSSWLAGTSSGWTLLHSGNGVVNELSTDVTTLSEGSIEAFKYFRVVIKSKRNANGSGHIRLNNVQFFGGKGSWDLAQQPYKVRINSTSGLTGTSTAKIGFPVTWTTAAAANLNFDTTASTTHTLLGTDGGGGTNRTFTIVSTIPVSSPPALPSDLELTTTTAGGVITGQISAVGTTSVTFRLTDNASGLFTDRAINILGITGLYPFSPNPFKFTNGGQTGKIGPQLATLTGHADYSAAAWRTNPAHFNLGKGYYPNSGSDANTPQRGFQLWTVPKDATYTIQAQGALGGDGTVNANQTPGKGARVQADFALTKGTKIIIIVGQGGTGATHNQYSGGGGGGTFVLKNNFATSTNDIYLIAGGGQGTSEYNNATVTYSSANGSSQGTSSNGGSGGGNGNGGGGGWGTNGQDGGTGYTTFGRSVHNFLLVSGSSTIDTSTLKEPGYGGDTGNQSTQSGVGGFGGGGAGFHQSPGGGGGYGGGRGGYFTGNSGYTPPASSWIMPNGTTGITVTNRTFSGNPGGTAAADLHGWVLITQN